MCKRRYIIQFLSIDLRYTFASKSLACCERKILQNHGAIKKAATKIMFQLPILIESINQFFFRKLIFLFVLSLYFA